MMIVRFTSTSEFVSAAPLTGMKHLKINDTTLDFKEIIYIDNTNDNDETGDGTNSKPFSTVIKGFDYMNEDCPQEGAIVVKDGSYDVSGLFTVPYDNLKADYNNMKLTIIAKTLGEVEFLNSREWHVSQHNSGYRIKLKMYGIRIKSDYSHGHLGGDDWTNEYYNCVFESYYGGFNLSVSNANVYFENCLFMRTKNSCYSSYPISGTALNCASIDNDMDPYNGIKKNALYNVTIDEDYNITSTAWKNAGEGKNPDGSQAHIGVYGNQFAWGSNNNCYK